jgi:hypothetical protein
VSEETASGKGSCLSDSRSFTTQIEGDIHVGVILWRKAAMEATKKDLEEMWAAA